MRFNRCLVGKEVACHSGYLPLLHRHLEAPFVHFISISTKRRYHQIYLVISMMKEGIEIVNRPGGSRHNVKSHSLFAVHHAQSRHCRESATATSIVELQLSHPFRYGVVDDKATERHNAVQGNVQSLRLIAYLDIGIIQKSIGILSGVSKLYFRQIRHGWISIAAMRQHHQLIATLFQFKRNRSEALVTRFLVYLLHTHASGIIHDKIQCCAHIRNDSP